MTRQELLKQLRICRRYQEAIPWAKPLINPRRFSVNQLRKYRLLTAKPGELRRVRTFHLEEFTVVNHENVSEEIASYGIYERALTEAFLQLVNPGDVVVDVGMHLGYYATLFALLVGPEGQVHAFEPTPSTREIAEWNVRQFSHIRVHPMALWSSEHQMSFRDYGPRWMAFNSFTRPKIEEGPPPPKVFEVQATSLDHFRAKLGQRIALIKIDAESAEEEILRGANSLLGLDRPTVSIEVGDVGAERTSRRALDYLAGLGYTGWEFVEGRFQRHNLQASYSYDNLIFAPSSADLSKLRAV